MKDDTSPALQTRFDRPPGWQWGTFENTARARLRYGYSEPPEGCRARIVLLTGFREFGEKYFETARDLLDLEYAVWQLDWYGQGGSDRLYDNRQKIGAASLVGAVSDLHAFVTTVLPKDRDTPLILVTHSTGGLIVLRFLHDHPGTVVAAAMSAPLFAPHTGPLPAWLVRGLARLGVITGFASSYIPGAGDWRQSASGIVGNKRNSRDPERGMLQDLWMRAHPNLRMGGVTYGWLDMAFRLTVESARVSYLRSVSTPILIGSAGEDLFVRSAAHRRAVELLSDARLVSFPEARHELFMETDTTRDRWLTEIDRFIDTEIGRLQGKRKR